MNLFRITSPPLDWPKSLLFAGGAVTCFHIAYATIDFGPLRLCILGYLICLVQLARMKTTRRVFYTGLVVGLLCVAPQLDCFWRIFGPAALPLWLILAFWIAAFVALIRVTLSRFGPARTALLLPFVWTGLEYFRSELYFLKFSWLNVGYAFSDWPMLPFRTLGMYGVGFLLAVCASLFLAMRRIIALTLVLGSLAVFGGISLPKHSRPVESAQCHVAAVQLEFPDQSEIPQFLDRLVARHPEAELLVLSEYTLGGPPPKEMTDWCREHQKYLVVGGKDPAPNNNFYDTAFVIGTTGEVVFKQVKAVPIQFFKDGLPAPEQKVWESPWGKIGICICYDLSYTRVTDRLIRLGAQAIIVPTMDVEDWGRRQHELHARVAPIRAAEYGLPIFRVASSGISQAVDKDGRVYASAPFPGQGEMISATLLLPEKGSLPLDRLLAPFCVVVTALLLLMLGLTSSERKSRRMTGDRGGVATGEATV